MIKKGGTKIHSLGIGLRGLADSVRGGGEDGAAEVVEGSAGEANEVGAIVANQRK